MPARCTSLRALLWGTALAPLLTIAAPLQEAWEAGRLLTAVARAEPTRPDEEVPGPVRWVRYGARGPALLLIHGAHREGIDEPRFAALARALAGAGLRVIAPELPGLSKLRLRAEDLDVLDAVAPEDAALFGVSLGGALALRLAADHPGRFRAVWTLGAPEDLAETVARHRGPQGHPYAREVFAQAFGPRLAREGLAPFRPLLRRLSPRGHLSRLDVPVFALHGQGDPLVDPANAERICRGARRCRALVTPALGHAGVAATTAAERLRLARFVADALRALRRAPPLGRAGAGRPTAP